MEATGAFQTLRKFAFQEKKLPAKWGEPTHDLDELRVEDGYLKFRTTGADPFFTLPELQIPADEVSVIDSGSSDDTVTRCRAYPVRLYEIPACAPAWGGILILILQRLSATKER